MAARRLVLGVSAVTAGLVAGLVPPCLGGDDERSWKVKVGELTMHVSFGEDEKEYHAEISIPKAHDAPAIDGARFDASLLAKGGETLAVKERPRKGPLPEVGSRGATASALFVFERGAKKKDLVALIVSVDGARRLFHLDAEATPGAAIDYSKLAFFPDRWKEKNVSTQLVPWEGEHIVFLSTKADLDRKVVATLLARLDGGWRLYAELTGAKPAPHRLHAGKPPIAAVPDVALTCGAGCGYIGATGIEAGLFYDHDYPLLVKDAAAFPHYLFYEMGRNYFTFGDRHSLFTTGFAVFMRYVCMDALGCEDRDLATRKTIEECEEVYAKSTMPFLDAFTDIDVVEKGSRLKTAEGRALVPSDQACIYTSAMLKLRRDHGGDAWLKRFFAELAKCPETPVTTRAEALKQARSWLVAASIAAKKDLTATFVERWRMPLGDETKAALSKVDWTKGDAATAIASLPEDASR